MARRNHRISARYDDDELELLYKYLKESMLENVSEFVRQSTLTGNVKPPISAEVKALLRAIIKELQAQGNNINQIAKAMNTAGIQLPEDFRELVKQNKEMLAIMKSIAL